MTAARLITAMLTLIESDLAKASWWVFPKFGRVFPKKVPV